MWHLDMSLLHLLTNRSSDVGICHYSTHWQVLQVTFRHAIAVLRDTSRVLWHWHFLSLHTLAAAIARVNRWHLGMSFIFYLANGTAWSCDFEICHHFTYWQMPYVCRSCDIFKLWLLHSLTGATVRVGYSGTIIFSNHWQVSQVGSLMLQQCRFVVFILYQISAIFVSVGHWWVLSSWTWEVLQKDLLVLVKLRPAKISPKLWLNRLVVCNYCIYLHGCGPVWAVFMVHLLYASYCL